MSKGKLAGVQLKSLAETLQAKNKLLVYAKCRCNRSALHASIVKFVGQDTIVSRAQGKHMLFLSRCQSGYAT